MSETWILILFTAPVSFFQTGVHQPHLFPPHTCIYNICQSWVEMKPALSLFNIQYKAHIDHVCM